MKRENLRQKLLANARAIIAHEVAIPMGCIRMSKILTWLGDDHSKRYPVFRQYMDAVQDLPIASERLERQREALLEKDRELEAINQQYRIDILNACFDIVQHEQADNYA